MDRVEREVTLPAPTAQVWEMLTDPALLSEWFGADVELDARPGGTATFRWPDGSEGRALVERADPRRALVFRWLPYERDPDGATRMREPSRVEFTLEERDAQTVLRVTEARLRGAHDPSALAGARL